VPHEAFPLSPAEVALVFGPAVLGYALVTLAAVMAAWRERTPGRLASRRRLVALVALLAMTLHVLLLWSLRYGFDPALATRNGWTGFATFHLAFVLAWATLPGDWLRPGWRRWLLIAVWLLVTSGAVGAPFRYPIVSALALPVLVIASLGAIGLVWAALPRQLARDGGKRG
jgi:hypothetical protein